MAGYKSFEDTEMWQISMEVCTSVYDVSKQKDFEKDFALRDQIRRSAISIPSNIAEGFDRSGKRQTIYFLYIVKGSCGELITQLMIARNLNYITNDQLDLLKIKIDSISKQIRGYVKYLESKN